MSVDDLVREWALRAGSSDRLRANERLIRFLGEWLFPDYQPFPEKATFGRDCLCGSIISALATLAATISGPCSTLCCICCLRRSGI